MRDPETRPLGPTPRSLLQVTAVAVARCVPRAGQQFGDLHIAHRTGSTRRAAEDAAADAAARLAADRSPGRPFRVTGSGAR